MTYQLHAIIHTDPGRIRKHNEDSVFQYVRPTEKGAALGILIVADGIGGQKAGDIASKMAVDTIFEALTWFLERDQAEDTKPLNQNLAEASRDSNGENFLETRLRKAIAEANVKILDYAKNNPIEAGNMGTTLTCALVWGSNLVLAHVGDSRAYRLREGRLEQLTEDHSFVGQMVRDGQLPEEAYYVHPRRNVITRALGQYEDVEIDLSTDMVLAGDRYLLCSDGLWEMVRDHDIKDHLKRTDGIQSIAESLIRLANENGGQDNVSLVIGEIIENGRADGK